MKPPWTVAALALAACTVGNVNRPVEEVKLQGNKAFSDGDIVDHLATQPPQGWLVKTPEEFDPVGLQLDRRRVEAFYHEHGYFSAHVTNVNVQRNVDDKGGVKVSITVEEGEPTKIASISVEGPQSDVAQTVFRHRDTLKKGDTFVHPDYLLAKDMLQKELVKRGYAHAKVDGVIEVDRVGHQAVVRYDIDPGPMCVFGDTKIEGLKTMPEDMVRDRVAWDKGRRFDSALLETTEGRLQLTGFFSAVRTEYEHEGRPEVVDVTVRLSEASKHELRLGFGAGVDRSRFELRLRGGYTERSILDDPRLTVRFDATPGYSWQRSAPFTDGPSIEALAELVRDDFLFGRLRGIAQVAFERDPRPGYILTGPRASVALEYPFANDDIKVRLGYLYRFDDFSDYDPTVFMGEAVSTRLAYFQERLIYDHRDFPLEAREGYYGDVEVLEGGPWAGGEVGVARVTPELRAYVPLGGRIVVAARARGGKLWTAGDGEAPLPIRYYGGGANDHRGFGYQRLAPQRRDMAGDLIPVGGSEMLLGSLETRFDLFKFKKHWFSTVVFLDSGDVTAPGQMDVGNLHYAVGLGLRYDTIVGPVRADVGFRLNRWQAAGADGLANPDPGDRFAFHLSLGEAF